MKIEILFHHKVFSETAIGISDALFLLGINAHTNKNNSNTQDIKYYNDVIYIILGAHRLIDPMPKYYIVVQSEQVGSRFFNDAYFRRLDNALCVWDFSPKNVKFLTENKRVRNVLYIPMRVPMATFFESGNSLVLEKEKDIDVLFYGAVHPRRKSLENNLKKLKRYNIVFRYYDLFDRDRDHLINRSKIVLNVHYYEQSSLETHRIEYLCSKAKCVISEYSTDSELDEEYKNCVVFSHSKNMINNIVYFLSDLSARTQFEVKALEESYRRQSNVDAMRKSLRL